MATGSTGGISEARLLEITESTNTKWNYNTAFKGKKLKLALRSHVTGWQVLSVRDWQDLELSA